MPKRKHTIIDACRPAKQRRVYTSNPCFYCDEHKLDSCPGGLRTGMACEECMEAGRAVGCTHMTHIMPHWLSQERSELVKCLYGDNEAAYNREAQGLIASSNVYVFNRRLIKALQIRRKHVIRDKDSIREIHISIDPHGGGDSSEFAIFAISYLDGKPVVSALIH